MNRPTTLRHLCSILLPALAFAASLALGESPVSLGEALSDPASPARAIVMEIRLPHACMAAVAGFALAFSGSALQSLLRNPLADPFILGVSGGAALGATVGLVVGSASIATALGPLWTGMDGTWPSIPPGTAASAALVLPALAGAVGATGLVALASTEEGRLSPLRALLAGVIFNALASACITLLKSLASPERQAEISRWLSGGIPTTTIGEAIALAAFVALAFAMVFRRSHGLNLLGSGDRGAAALGLDVDRTRRSLFLWLSLTVAAAVTFTGMIGFVGLVVPHLARPLCGSDCRRLLPVSGALGAACVLMADTLARMALPLLGTVPPAGALTALAGAPFFLVMLRRGRHP